MCPRLLGVFEQITPCLKLRSNKHDRKKSQDLSATGVDFTLWNQRMSLEQQDLAVPSDAGAFGLLQQEGGGGMKKSDLLSISCVPDTLHMPNPFIFISPRSGCHFVSLIPGQICSTF